MANIIPGVNSSDPNSVLGLTDVFGTDQCWDSPVGSGPAGTQPWTPNPHYFATGATADKVVTMVGGGAVVPVDPFKGSPFSEGEPRLMVQTAGGGLINAGLVAEFFTHNYPLGFVAAMIAHEVSNVNAGN